MISRTVDIEQDAIRVAEQPLSGVNLVGYLEAEMGLGEAARKLGRALERAGTPFSEIPYRRTASRQEHPFESGRPEEALYDTNIICLNPRQLPEFMGDAGIDFFAGRYSIGVWFWETSRFPDVNLNGFHFVDEVWVASEFVRAAVSAATWKPVFVVPLPIEEPLPPRLARADLGLPEGFLFLFSFDFLSAFERKNPTALVEAFTKAFAPGEGPNLVIKSINGHRKPSKLEQLRRATGGRPDIHLLDGYVSAEEKDAMMATCDCYVSLHRSEGFGLTMAEAMSYARPVIATGYSGNLEFMDEANSYLVPYELVRIPDDSAYPPDTEWADPDVDAAASLMRKVYELQDEARARGERAREDILGRFTLERTAEFLSNRLVEIGQRRTQAWPSAGDPRIPLIQIAAEVSKGIGGDLRLGAQRRGPAALVRRFLLRALWPYLDEQHRLNAAVLDALAELGRSHEAELEGLRGSRRPSMRGDGVRSQNAGASAGGDDEGRLAP